MVQRGASPRAAALAYGIGQHHIRRLIREGPARRFALRKASSICGESRRSTCQIIANRSEAIFCPPQAASFGDCGRVWLRLLHGTPPDPTFGDRSNNFLANSA